LDRRLRGSQSRSGRSGAVYMESSDKAPQLYVEESSKLHAPVTSSPATRSVGGLAWWFSGMVWMRWRQRNSLSLPGVESLESRP